MKNNYFEGENFAQGGHGGKFGVLPLLYLYVCIC